MERTKGLFVILFLLVSMTGLGQNNFFWSYSGLGEIVISTNQPSDIGTTTAISGGEIIDNGSAVIQRGVVVKTTSNPTVTSYDKITTDGSGSGSYGSSISGLNTSTLYYVRAYAINSVDTVYGNQFSFTTGSAVSLPTVITGGASSITTITAYLDGNVTATGGATVTERGICYGRTDFGIPDLTPTYDYVISGSGTGTFSAYIEDYLDPASAYYYRAYATNSAGTSYGELRSFTTLAEVVKPTVTTTTASSITTNSASLGGNVTNDGGGTVTERGIVYTDEIEIPDINNATKDSNGSGTGSFSETIGSLSPSTYYAFRAYAINGAGVSYGSLKVFQTSTSLLSPTIVIDSIYNETMDGASIDVNVTSDGGSTITGRGIWVSRYEDFTTYNDYPTSGTTGTFTITVDDLTCADEYYYVRAYAINGVGKSESSDSIFYTISPTYRTPLWLVTGCDYTAGGSVEITDSISAQSVCDAITFSTYSKLYTQPVKLNDDTVIDIGDKIYLYAYPCMYTPELRWFIYQYSPTMDYIIKIENGIVTNKYSCD